MNLPAAYAFFMQNRIQMRAAYASFIQNRMQMPAAHVFFMQNRMKIPAAYVCLMQDGWLCLENDGFPDARRIIPGQPLYTVLGVQHLLQ